MFRIYSIYFLLLISFSQLTAQTSKLQPFFTGLVVADVDSSIAWYSRVLGLKLRNRVDNEQRGFKQVVLINEEVMIELVELNKSISITSALENQSAGTKIHGFNKFGFSVPDIDSLFQQLAGQGVTFYGKMVVDPVNNKKTFLITDPDGNLIQFFEK